MKPSATREEILRSGIPKALIDALIAGRSVEVGSCLVSPDVDNQMIWITDPYGLDSCAAQNYRLGDADAAIKAIHRAVDVDGGDNLHDLMYCSAPQGKAHIQH